MSFIKNFTEKLLESEYRPIANFYSSKNIGENTEHLGLIKQAGTIAYGVVIINADLKYDYKGFYKDVLSFFSQLKKVIVIGVFVSCNPQDELIKFTTNNIEDYQESIIDVRWTVDITQNKLIVNGEQPDKILEIDRLIKESFHNGGYTVSQDLNTLQQKSIEKRQKQIRSSNIALTLALIFINGAIELFSFFADLNLNGNFIINSCAVERNSIISGQWYRLITYMFIHGSLNHYLGNALSLYIFGSRIERYYGKKSMIIIYFVSGIGAGVLSMICNGGPAVGASGAIFGLMAGILTYTRVKNCSMEGFDNYLMIIFAVVGIFSGFLMDNVDNWGHIGGFITGIITSLVVMRGDKDESV
ncbi:MAG: rhomboid family intramembrane serine protease [Clostridia bacterium]|nr:rhomboid family intramembrane serine protease [Clostridia bacterium]